jgi:hypothetical protein
MYLACFALPLSTPSREKVDKRMDSGKSAAESLGNNARPFLGTAVTILSIVGNLLDKLEILFCKVDTSMVP